MVREYFISSVCCNTSGSAKDASATEQAMLILMEKAGINYEEIRQHHFKEDPMRFHFTSKRKRMSTIIENCGITEHGYDKRCLMKGASEYVLDSCSHYLDEEGIKHELTIPKKGEFLGSIYRYADNALRTISFASKDLNPHEGGPEHDEDDRDGGPLKMIEKEGFTLICIVGIKDIIRQEVPSAVRAC